jgi:uncharacterized protein YkwD
VAGNPIFRPTSAMVIAVLVLALAPGVASASAGSRLLAGVNQARVSHGVAPLRYSRNLARSASGYSHYMLARNYFGHLSRIRASWSRWSWVGENLAMYYGWGTRVGSIVRGWLNSPPHRRVMLDPRFRSGGVGLAHGRMAGRRATTVTLHVGKHR